MILNGYRAGGHTVVLSYNREELTWLVAEAAGFIKPVAGIANNAAWAAALEAHDHVKTHSRYRHEVKKAFRKAIEAFHEKERTLVYGKRRLFHVDDLMPEYRKRYGNITDAEYYEYWCNTGATAYVRTRQWAMNVRNKYRISLEAHGIREAETVAWAMMANACLRLADVFFANTMALGEEKWNVPRTILEEILGELSMGKIADMWDAATEKLVPMFELTDSEQKNIQYALDQLMEQWSSIATITNSIMETVEAHDDLFRTKGEQKKALLQVAEWDV